MSKEKKRLDKSGAVEILSRILSNDSNTVSIGNQKSDSNTISTGNRKKVEIVFMDEPNFEELGFKYLVLSLNKVQNCFEFEFPDSDSYPLGRENYEIPGIPVSKLKEFASVGRVKGDFFIGIFSGNIGNNWFWAKSDNFGILTTVDWKKEFAPPSVLEFVVHCIVSLLISMSDSSGTLVSHNETRGCCLDFTLIKEEDKVDIALGYLCSDCKERILSSMGREYLECFEKMNSQDWIGDPLVIGTVASNLKKYFKIDLYKGTGFYKGTGEQIRDFIVELPKEGISAALTTSIGIIVGFVLAKLLGA